MTIPTLTISKVAAQAVTAPLTRPIRTAVGTIPSAPLVLIDVETREGVTGRAYIFAYTATALPALRRLVIDIGAELEGKSAVPADIMRFFDRRFRLLGWQGLVGMAISGLDMALWDALGRAAGEPVVRLLGGEVKALPAYDSFGVIDPSADADIILQSVAMGFKAIKIKLGDGDVSRDISTVMAVRKLIGPDIKLMVDFNQSLNVPDAIDRIQHLEAFDLHWIEEPVHAEDLQGHADVRRATGAKIQTGENWWFPAGMAASIAIGASNHAMPDLMKIGGVTGWLEAARLAATAGLPVSSHLFLEASSHVMAVTPTAHFVEWLDVAGAILSEPYKAVNGTVSARGPGLGLEWNSTAVTRFAL